MYQGIILYLIGMYNYYASFEERKTHKSFAGAQPINPAREEQVTFLKPLNSGTPSIKPQKV